jgi:hypothetical protein
MLDHLLPSLQPHFISEGTLASFERFLVEIYTAFLEKYQVTLEMLE